MALQMPLPPSLTAPALLRVQGPQDLKLCLGYDLASKQPYARVKENNWAVRHSAFCTQAAGAR